MCYVQRAWSPSKAINTELPCYVYRRNLNLLPSLLDYTDRHESLPFILVIIAQLLKELCCRRIAQTRPPSRLLLGEYWQKYHDGHNPPNTSPLLDGRLHVITSIGAENSVVDIWALRELHLATPKLENRP